MGLILVAILSNSALRYDVVCCALLPYAALCVENIIENSML